MENLNLDLLTFVEIEKMITDTETYNKAVLISSKIKDVLFTYKDFTFRFNKDAIAYDSIENKNDDYLITLISFLLSKSKEKLSSDNRHILESRYPKVFPCLADISRIKQYIPIVRTLLNETEYKFSDCQFNKIHFKNGYYDMTNGQFFKRIKNKDFVNFYIPRNYKKATQSSIDKVMGIIKQIYPVECERNYLLQSFAFAMTGTSTIKQKILILLGKGSSGKSTIIEMLSLAFSNYIIALDRTLFSRGTTQTQVNKILNTFLANRNIRITHINEPEDTKMDETLFKDFVDGNIKTTSLFKDGQNVFKHYSKITFTSNTMPKIKMDTGVIRRLEAHKTLSNFTDKKEDVNEAKHIYLKNENLLTDLSKSDDLMNAICDIIFDYALKYHNGEVFPQPESFRDIKDEIVHSNDVIGDFIEKYMIKTDNEKDKVGKSEAYDMFKQFKPKSLITEAQFREDMQHKGFEYQWKPKKNGIQGIFIKCKMNLVGNIEELDYENQFMEMENENLRLSSENTKLQDQIKQLQEQIKQLQEQQNTNNIPVVNKPVVKPRKKINDDLDADLAELEKELLNTKCIKNKEPKTETIDDDELWIEDLTLFSNLLKKPIEVKQRGKKNI
jgi:phage/plasmid-associated DNA primase